MIIPKHNVIINIEVKLGPKVQGDKLKLLKDASDQTKQHFSFMLKLFGGILSKEWVFVRAACVPYLTIIDDTTIPCVNCQPFILQDKDVNDVTPWLKQLIEHNLVPSYNCNQAVYKNIVAELIYHISIKESSKFDRLISDPLTISRETENAFTGKTVGISGESDVPESMLTNEQKSLTGKIKGLSEKSVVPDSMLTSEHKALAGKDKGLSEKSDVPDPILTNEQKALTDLLDDNKAVYMLNNDQLQAVHSPTKCLIIEGDYGTGKTYVLKERAKKCAIDNSTDQLFYIDLTALTHKAMQIFTKCEFSVMDIIAVEDFDSYPNITVITAKEFGTRGVSMQTHIVNSLNSFLRENHCDHLFIDEMIIGGYVFSDSIKTICVNLKILDGHKGDSSFFREILENEKEKWIETMKMNHNAVHVNLTKNMRNSQQIIHLAKALGQDSKQQVSCSLDTNVMGTHNFYYRNVYDIRPSLLVVAAVKKYFKAKPTESVVVLADISFWSEVFEMLHKHFSSITSVVRNFTEYMKKPEGILVTVIMEFQGAQARNIIICDSHNIYWDLQRRNLVLRTMSFAIFILEKDNNKLNSSGAIEDKNLHEYIYPEGKAPECHHYHNKDKHDISALTMAILDKYKLFDQDESIAIITYSRISKDIIREANTKRFLKLSKNEKEDQIEKNITLETQELSEDVKRNISRNFADTSWSYYHIHYNPKEVLKDLVNKPRHVNYIKVHIVSNYEYFRELKNIIVFADENIDHKHEFAAWRHSLNYSDDVTSIDVERSKRERNEYDMLCSKIIMLYQPKFAIVVHDDDFDMFSGPKGALNLIEDNNLHEHIPVQKTDLSNQ